MTMQAEVDFGVQLLAGLGQVAGQLDTLNKHHARERARRAELNGKLMPLNVDLQPIPVTAGAGLLDVPRLLQPPLGWTWQIDAVGVQGFSAGSVTMFLNSVQGVQLFTFNSAGVLYQRHMRFMRYGERLLFSAAGITGAPAVWVSGIAYTDDIQGEVLL
jgi:hypothetical protein